MWPLTDLTPPPTAGLRSSPPASSPGYHGEPSVEMGQSFCCGAEANPAGEGQMKGLP